MNSGPIDLATADFNHDGIPDLVVGLQNANSIAVLIGTGRGNYKPPVIYPLGQFSQAVAVATADLDGNGTVDLAIANFTGGTTNQVTILLGNGDGTFQPATSFPANGFCDDIAVADFNGDGKLDLITANETSYNLSIFYGNGNGTFQQPPQIIALTAGTFAEEVVVGDFNGDGRPDFAVSTGTNAEVFLNGGNGTFTLSSTLSAYAVYMAVADLNIDGHADLMLSGYDLISVWIGQGNGSFTEKSSYTIIGVNSVAVADLNNDGKLDLVATANEVVTFLGNGDGTFQNPNHYIDSGFSEGVAVADFNGDGRLDVAVANRDGNSVGLIFGNGNGTFQAATNYATPPYPSFVVPGDFNNDGKPDLAVTYFSEFSSGAAVLLGNGDGSFNSPLTIWPFGVQPSYMATGDFNNDGNLDVVIADDFMYVLLGHGDGTFGTAQQIATATYTTFVGTGDVNGDGKLDLISVGPSTCSKCTTSSVFVRLGNGDGTFASPTETVADVNSNVAALGKFSSTAQFPGACVGGGNANKHPPTTSALTAFQGAGDGSFSSATNLLSGDAFPSVVVGDFNLDGNLDIAAINGPSNTILDSVSIFLGNGDGTFQTPVNYTIGAFPVFLASALFNGGSALDLVAANQGETGYGKPAAGSISVLINNGDGTFAKAQEVLQETIPVGIAIADFNLDGAPDMAVANSAIPSVSVFLNERGTKVKLTSSPNPSRFGQSVTFTVHVASGVVASGLPTPTGTITIKDGSMALGTAALTNGAASVKYSGLIKGSHNISATYSGDTNYNSNGSALLIQVVN